MERSKCFLCWKPEYQLSDSKSFSTGLLAEGGPAEDSWCRICLSCEAELALSLTLYLSFSLSLSSRRSHKTFVFNLIHTVAQTPDRCGLFIHADFLAGGAGFPSSAICLFFAGKGEPKANKQEGTPKGNMYL